jgi:N-acetylneuraminic acid mutarotase
MQTSPIRFFIACLFCSLVSPVLSYSQGKWTEASSIGFTGRFGAACAEVDGKIYVIGGQLDPYQGMDENTDLVEMYDPKTDIWKELTVSGTFTPRRNIATAVIDGKIYTLGGDLNTKSPSDCIDIIEVFNPKTLTWSTLPSIGLPKPLTGMRAIVSNNKIYTFCGISDDSVITQVTIFDPATNTWSIPVTSGNFTPRYRAAVALVNNKVYVMGGGSYNNSQIIFHNTVDVFDLSTNSWANIQTSGYFQKRTGATTQVVDGKIYVMGGSDGYSFSNAFEVFDPTTNTWNTPATTGTFSSRNGSGSAVVDGKIYVLGGASYINNGSVWNFNEALDPKYIDPSSLYGTWTTGSSEGFTKRASFTASAVNGKIYVIGGYDSSAMVNPIEVYDPTIDSWSTLTTTGTYTPRSNATANVVNGKIYIIGGYDNTSLVTDIDVFDPSTNSWSTPTTTGDFYPRAQHTSAVVNGRIYVIGGADQVSYIDVVDEFDPATNTWLSLSTIGVFDGRHAMTSCAYKDKVYVHGGFNSNSRIWCNWIDVFDPSSNSLAEAQITGEFAPNCYVSSGLVDGEMYIIGGNTPDGLTRITRAYDIETTKVRTVITTGQFTPRNSTGCDTLNGKIYVLGGYFYDGTSEAILNTVEILTPTPVNAVTNSPAQSGRSMITPNPASSAFTVSTIEGDVLTVTVLDLLGKVLITAKPTEQQATVDISTLPTGAYYVKIEKSTGSEMQILIKK